MQQTSFSQDHLKQHAAQSTANLVQTLKQNNDDMEWYPTSDSQINIICADINQIASNFEFDGGYHETIKILEIGAGDSRVSQAIKKSLSENVENKSCQLFAIEKAETHIREYRHKDVTLLGTDFYETNLFSKNCHIAYVNPPYSDFTYWLDSILSQLNFNILYAVIPQRWQESEQLQDAMTRRGLKRWDILAESDFLDADRKARCKVHVVRFSFDSLETKKYEGRRYRHSVSASKVSPFQDFLENEIGLKKTYSDTCEKFNEYREVERVKKEMQTEGTPCFELVKSRGVLWALLEAYERDLKNVFEQYKMIGQLDPNLLQELGVKYEDIKTGVTEKLYGFRGVYWKALFEELSTLSERLTNTHRKTLLNSLNNNGLDFTYKNALYICEYACAYASELIESSITDIYKTLTDEKSIARHYVSNAHVYKDDWRMNRHYEDTNKQAKYILDFRFIHSSWGNFSAHSWEKGLNENAQVFTTDLVVILNLLGYSGVYMDQGLREIVGGDKLGIWGTTPDGQLVKLIEIKYFLNGNKHLRFDQHAMARLNVTASRLLGWCRSKQEFEQETAQKKPVSDEAWEIGDNLTVLPSNVLKLTHTNEDEQLN